MNKILGHLEAKPLSGSDIQDAVDGQTKVIRYSAIHRFRTIDQLLAPYDSAVILYETREGFGHWTCVFLNRRTGVLEFFDPYGKPIDSQLDHIPPALKASTYQDYPYLAKLMLASPYKLTYNQKPLQKLGGDVNSCGRHVAMRLVMRDLPISQYQQFLLQKKGGALNPDGVVSMMTAFI
jgi:hypothetical protein